MTFFFLRFLAFISIGTIETIDIGLIAYMKRLDFL